MGRIAAGYEYTCVVTSVGGVKCWGANRYGQLGNGTTGELAVPGAVEVFGLESRVSAISAGFAHTCALTSGGGVKCWGYNEYGQLGNGSNADSSVPVDVVGLASGVSAISAGEHDTCALTRAGGVKCWGWNPRGQLGDGTSTDRNRPVAVEGLASGITAVSAGTLHTCALTSSGGVMCWGFGPAVDPSLAADSYIPVSVPNLASGVTAIAAGLDRACALKTGGGATCWGRQYAPPSDEVPRDWMVQLDTSGLSSEVSAIVVGQSHACALTSEGGVACWGDNSYGQLGHFRKSSDAVLVQAPGLASGVTAVTVGGGHTCALTTNDAVRCWGSNGYGQLGSVTRCTSSSAPVDVPLDADAPTPPAGSTPSGAPIGRIEHATGSTDVVLRFDRGPDFAVGDLVGELFQPGPEFTLYGDGTVIFRNEAVPPPPPEGTILRARPFKTAQLDEQQVQSLLRFALGEGGLGAACEVYETQDSDVAGSDVWTIRAGGLDKRVVDVGSGPFAALKDDLRNFDRRGIQASVWVPDRFWGNLLDAIVFKGIGDGVTPGLAKFGSVPWPWPGVAPAAFVGLAELGSGRRVMSADEAAVLGLSDKGGVVQRIYLRDPDSRSIYYFSLWPMFPDEGDPGSGYTDDEARLLSGLRSDARFACAPRRVNLPPRALAGVECSSKVDPVDRIGVFLFGSQDDLLDAYFDRLAGYGVEPRSGSCPERPGERAYVPGDGGGTYQPHRLGCFLNEYGNANYRVTVPDSLVYLGILGTGKDLAALHDWAWLGNRDVPGSPTVWREPAR